MTEDRFLILWKKYNKDIRVARFEFAKERVPEIIARLKSVGFTVEERNPGW